MRQVISCYPCRQRKSKCDGRGPCDQGTRRESGDGCHYAAYVRRRGKAKKQADGGAEKDGMSASEDEDGQEGEVQAEQRSWARAAGGGSAGQAWSDFSSNAEHDGMP
jgi:hypothetical protein